MSEASISELTVFVKSAEFLIAQLEEAAVDYPAFDRKYRPCELSRCRATCCHDGVYLSAEDAQKVEVLAEEARRVFPDLAESLPETCTEQGDSGRWKTKTRDVETHELADDYPSHFPKTKCVFLDVEDRCALQRLSVKEGKHAWFYKPITCWMHPVTLRKAKSRNDRPLLTLYSSENDPQKSKSYPGFSSCTHCGRVDEEGLSGETVFRSELEMLANLSRRRLL